MTTQEILGAISVVLILVGGVWGVIKMLLMRDRKSVDDRAAEAAKINEDARNAIWKRLDELRSEVVNVQVEQGILRERVRSLPDHDALRERLDAMEERLEKRLASLVTQVQEAFTAATSKFRCPYDHTQERG